MNEPRWILRDALILLHSETLAEHGGATGLPDTGRLDAAPARPQQIFAYETGVDLAKLAAAYAGWQRAIPFVDGNKRVAFVAMGLFLHLNGFRLTAGPVDATCVMLEVAAGSLSEDDLSI